MPTVTIGDNTGDTYSGTADNWLNETNPVNNGGAYEYFVVSGEIDVGDRSSSLLKFTGISSIPVGKTITDATVYLKAWFTQAVNGFSFTRVLRNWGEGIHTGAAISDGESSWNCYSYPSTWTTAGCKGSGTDKASSASYSTNKSFTSEAYASFTSAGILDDVTKFYNGTYSNYGWVLEAADGYMNEFYSRNYTSGNRPYLSVTYTNPGTGNFFELF